MLSEFTVIYFGKCTTLPTSSNLQSFFGSTQFVHVTKEFLEGFKCLN